MDAVHKRSEEEGSTSAPPRREEITDTMIFSPSDLVTMICRDVDLNYATRGTNTHSPWENRKLASTDFPQFHDAFVLMTYDSF